MSAQENPSAIFDATRSIVGMENNRASVPTAEELILCLIRLVPELVALARYMGCDELEAEDAAQKTIIRGWRAIENGKVKRIRNRTTWLRWVTVLDARTILRRKRTYVPIDCVDEELLSFEDALAEVERDDMIALLRKAIDRLPKSSKDLVVFCSLQGHTYSEASWCFGMTQAAVKRGLEKAREQLRVLLAHCVEEIIES